MRRLVDFFRVTVRQQRGMAVLVGLLLVFVGLAAVKQCVQGRKQGPVVIVEPIVPLGGVPVALNGPGEKDSLFSFDPSTADSAVFVRLGFSPSQARTILNFRSSIGGRFVSAEQFARSYVVSDSMFARLRPYIAMADRQVPKPQDYSTVDVNRSALQRLRAHSTLDDDLAGKIFRARIRYGGFVDAAQLYAALPSQADALKRFEPYAVFDTAALVRYDVNLDSEDLLCEHPYITRPFAREILRYRELYGAVPCYDTLRALKYFPRSKDSYLPFYLNFRTVE